MTGRTYSRSTRRPRRCRGCLALERLEDRTLLDAQGPQLLLLTRSGEVETVRLDAGANVESALAAYRANPDILYAEVDQQVSVEYIPNDTHFAEQSALRNAADADIDADEAWDVTRGSTQVVVAVIDTGVDYTHPDLYRNIWINQSELPAGHGAIDTDGDGLITFWDLNEQANAGKVNDANGNGRIDGGDLLADPRWENGQDDDGNGRRDDLIGWDFANNDNNPYDDNRHGTHVSGIIGATGDNGMGVAGINWKVQIAALKFLNASGSGGISGAISALNYAVAEGIKISNNSWSVPGFSSTMSNALNNARAAGHVFIAAAGNSGGNNDNAPVYPASYTQDNVVAVAASTSSDARPSWSNYGATSVDLTAPGNSILSTVPGGYTFMSGTSMAAPHVTGAIALLWGHQPNLTYDQVIAGIVNNVDPLSNWSGVVRTGGRLNVFKALGTTPLPDTTGPRVISAVASGTDGIDRVRVTFSEAIASGSFNADDVTGFTGPAGGIDVAGVQAVAGSNNTQFDITFAAQKTAGAYQLVIGPGITDAAGNLMDQNNNGTNGEADDYYRATFTVSDKPSDNIGPRVVSAVAGGTSSVSYVEVTFSEPIDPGSFTIDDVTNFFGPNNTALNATGVAAVAGSNNTRFRVTFATQTTPGSYRLDVGPDIRDVAGNPMDQNNNGIPGEATDSFGATFTISGSNGNTFTNSTRRPIVDFYTTTSTIRVNQPLVIADLNIRLNITHTYDADLLIYLRGPDGTIVNLSIHRGGSGNNFSNTIFDDEAGTSIASGLAPFAGSYRPDEALSAFDNKIAAGTWTLHVADSGFFDTGMLNSWALIFTTGSGLTLSLGGEAMPAAEDDAALSDPEEPLPPAGVPIGTLGPLAAFLSAERAGAALPAAFEQTPPSNAAVPLFSDELFVRRDLAGQTFRTASAGNDNAAERDTSLEADLSI